LKRSPRPENGLVMTDDNRIIITVRDTGSGLAPEQLARIFEPFSTTKSSGTGLGLYVVKQLVEKNGGKIHVCSVTGEGTIFTITFLF
jgi:signal transduction histidine kinase